MSIDTVTPEGILTAEQLRRERLAALVNSYQGADRILTNEAVKVKADDYSGSTPAWTDGETIYINRSIITDVDVECIEVLNGLNFHELGHVMYSPRTGTKFVNALVQGGLETPGNILEDQRIETLLTTQYPSSAAWLSSAVARWILDSENTAEVGYMLTRGRKFLDGRLRGALRASFIRPDLLPEVDRIVDEYRLITLPTDTDRAVELVKDFKVIYDQILDSMEKEEKPMPEQGSGTQGGGQGFPNAGRPQPAGAQKALQKRASDGEPEEASTDEGGAGSQPEPDQGGTPTTEGAGEGQPSGQGEPEPGKNGRQAGQHDGQGTPQSLAEQLLQSFRSSVEYSEDMHRRQREIRNAGASDSLNKAHYRNLAPLPAYVALFGRLRATLRQLKAQADPGWSDRQSSGRINVGRFMSDRDVTTAFDAWDEGIHDATDLEVVIMYDESGSMERQSLQVANSMWVCKRALDSIEASTTVIGFDNNSQTLYTSKDKADGAHLRYTFNGGGTDPSDGLGQATRIFGRSTKSQKILMIFTDGEWAVREDFDGVTADEHVTRLRRAGVVTAVGFIGPDDERVTEDRFGHGAQLFRTVGVDDLVPFIKQIISASIKSKLVRH